MVEYDKKTDLATTRDMEVLSTYVLHPCDRKIPNRWDIPLLMSRLLCLIVNLGPIYNKGRLSWQQRPIQH